MEDGRANNRVQFDGYCGASWDNEKRLVLIFVDINKTWGVFRKMNLLCRMNVI